MGDHGRLQLKAGTMLRVGVTCRSVWARDRVWLRSVLLAGTGCAALVLGLLIYLADRPASHALLIPDLGLSGSRSMFGRPGQWLPSALHPLAFGLFTAALLKPGCMARVGACTFWGIVNAAFEIGQHPAFNSLWTAGLQGGAGESVVTRSILNYFIRGTFDPFDVCAALLGALAAGAFLHFADHFLEAWHALC
jgi:hypothetical protein